MINTLFRQAETERTKGSTAAAIPLYKQVIKESEDEKQIALSEHMLAVCLKVTDQLDEAERLLRELLKNKRLEPIHRGQILRDLGDTLRDQWKFDEASDALQESFELLSRHHAAPSEIAATMGIQARVMGDEEDYTDAVKLARQASDLFAESDDRTSELYHNIFFAGLLVMAERAEEAEALARHLLPAATEYGKPVHYERLQIIIDSADNPDAMQEAIEHQVNES